MASDLELTPDEQAVLDGATGEAAALAMRMVVALAHMVGAPRLVEVTRAHIDSCLFHGQAGLDFARHLADLGGRVVVPTTLNVSSLDLRHPALVRLEGQDRADARALMDAYERLGCRPTWTCAPYQLQDRPAFGEHVAWAESNAIVFANSVLGARTERYGDFIDICAALTGRVPDHGLHGDEARRGEVVFDCTGLADEVRAEAVVFPLVGHVVGATTGDAVPVVVGLPDASEDECKALGAAAASSGGVAMFHAVGSTPEAPTLAAALHDEPPARTVEVTTAMLRDARAQLTTSDATELAGVAVGTPHFSVAEFARLRDLFTDTGRSAQVPFHVNTGRDVWDQVVDRGWAGDLEAAGVTVVVDTCTYITPVLDTTRPGVVLTDSAKWAYYAPGNIGVEARFASLAACVDSAVAGTVVPDPVLDLLVGPGAP